MANPKIQVDLTADAKGLKKGAKEAGEAVEKLGKDADNAADKIDKAGDKADKAGGKFDGLARGKASEHLGAVGEAAEALGVDLDNVDTKLLAAGAGFAALGGVLVGGVQQWGQYTAQVRQYADAAGISTEEASRFAEVFRQFGIEADDGIDALKTLGEEAGDAPEKFRQYNVEIARAKDGSIDLAATMLNVAERFRTIQDPAQRAAMGAALFGDNWLRIAPLLDKGKQGLDELLKSVSENRVVTAEAEKQQREFEQAMRELEGTVQSLQMAIGRDAIPKLTMLAKDLGKAAEAVDKLSGRQGSLNDFISQFNPISAIYNARLRDQEDKAKAAAKSTEGLATATASAGIEAAASGIKQRELANAEQSAADKADILARKQDEVARSAQDAARGVEAHRTQLDLLNATVTTVVGTQLAYDNAVLSTEDSVEQLTTAAIGLNTEIANNGAASSEAFQAQQAYDRQLVATMQSIDGQAKAAADLAKKLAEASGQTFTAEQYNIVYRDSLVKVRDATNDGNLIGGLNGLIGLVDGTAASAGQAQRNLDAAAAAASRLAAAASNALQVTNSGQIVGSADSMSSRATGGMTMADVPYRVGESGEEVFVPQQNGRVLSVPQAQQALAGAMAGETGAQGGGASVIVVPVYLDGRKIAEATVRPNELIRRAGR